MPASVSLDLGQFLRTVNVPRAVQETLRAAVPIAQAGIRDNMQRQQSPDGVKWPGVSRTGFQRSGQPLNRTGRLMGSVQVIATASGLTATSSAPQARLMHEGGVVRPTRAKSLAIPVSGQAVRAGSPRKFGRKLFVHKANGKACLAEKVGRRFTVHYLLLKSVRVPARPYLGFSADTLGKVASLLNARLFGGGKK